MTKLEKGTAQPSAEIVFRVARYFKQPVESIFQHLDKAANRAESPMFNTILFSQSHGSISSSSRLSIGNGDNQDKSLVSPTAKVVAPLSRSKPKAKK